MNNESKQFANNPLLKSGGTTAFQTVNPYIIDAL